MKLTQDIRGSFWPSIVTCWLFWGIFKRSIEPNYLLSSSVEPAWGGSSGTARVLDHPRLAWILGTSDSRWAWVEGNCMVSTSCAYLLCEVKGDGGALKFNFICSFLKLFFIYFWLCWVFGAFRRIFLVAASRGYPSFGSGTFQCSGFCCKVHAQ